MTTKWPAWRQSRPFARLLAGRLVAETRPVVTLDAATREAMWQLYAAHYERVDAATFFSDLDAKDDVIVVRDASHGSVQGFTTLAVYPHVSGGRRATIVFSGDTIIAPAYQGQSALQRAFVRYVMGAAVAHRDTDVYWFLISKGYKTYLLLSRNFLEYWPRHDVPTPGRERTLLAELGRARFGAAFAELPPHGEAAVAPDPAYGIVRWDPPGPRLRADVAPVSMAARQAADVRFFLAANPGHADGDELCCLGRLDLRMGLNYLRRLALSPLRARLGARPS